MSPEQPPQLQLEVPYADLRHSAAEKLKKEIVSEVTERRFDLRHGPLIRASVVRLEDQVYELIIATHHVICDGWSVNVIVTELAALYAARRGATVTDLAQVLPFSRYATTEARRSDTAAKDWWVAQFASLPMPLELPAERLECLAPVVSPRRGF